MEKLYDVVIIGSGPAGLSAAIYAQRAKLCTLVIEKAGISGGQVLTTYEVDNYPALPGINGYDLGMKMKEHASKLDAEIVTEEVTEIETEGSIKKVHTETGVYETKSVIFATGAVHAKLEVPGEEELLGMGVSYCATCDGAFFKNRCVAVVGGGDVAIEDAIFLARNCKKVYLIHRRDELRGAKTLQESLFALDNVEMVWNSVVTSINGTDQVESINVLNKKTEENVILPVDGIFVAVGIRPNSELLMNKVACDEGKYIVADESGKTSVPGIFVAGDTRTKQLRQIVTAVADGANAVTSVQHFLLNWK